MPGLDRSTIANIETGRRQRIGVDEWLTLAFVLGVAPLHLLLPRGEDDPVTVAPKVTVTAGAARRWATGREPLPGQDERTFRFEVPESEHQRRSQRLQEAQTAVDKAYRRYRVAEARLDRLSEEATVADSSTPYSVTVAASRFAGMGGGGIDGHVDIAFERIAEAKVDLDDAIAHRNAVQREEGAEDGQR